MNQDAQKWWVIKSLEEFKKKLEKQNINLEIIEINTYRSFLTSFFIRKTFNLLEQSLRTKLLKFDNYLSKNFKNKKLNLKYLRNILMNLMKF